MWEQYGRVVRLRLPGNRAAALTRTDGPTEITFTAARNRTETRQDGRPMATAGIGPELTAGLRPARIA